MELANRGGAQAAWAPGARATHVARMAREVDGGPLRKIELYNDSFTEQRGRRESAQRPTGLWAVQQDYG
ncbi:hypothetical protein CR152_30680 [Massilia violaceinigra]|uniref:Uncharacterized protein n=1 Tax=Massilia violaceinigra TaxID=2045208 RepID=A0A2D2DTV7_9BURK|nr:hypothetical protein CR152_30680 [Massilia violaceinigra]